MNSSAKKPTFRMLVRAFSRLAAYCLPISVKLQFLLSLLHDTLKAGFPNLEHLASIALVLPITTATVELIIDNWKKYFMCIITENLGGGGAGVFELPPL